MKVVLMTRTLQYNGEVDTLSPVTRPGPKEAVLRQSHPAEECDNLLVPLDVVIEREKAKDIKEGEGREGKRRGGRQGRGTVEGQC